MHIDRIGSGLFAIAMLLWLLWPSTEWTLDPEPAVAFAVALCVWLWREWSASRASGETKAAPTAHPHDVSLAKKVRTAFDEQIRSFLRKHDFGAVFRTEYANQIFGIADEWHGLDYEFQDPVLDNAMFELLRLNRELSEKISTWSGPVRDSRLLSVPTDPERYDDFFSENTTKRVSELNELATNTLEAYEKLDREMRAKVPSIYEE